MLHGPTVYVVDDDAGILRSAGLLLESADLPAALFESPQVFLESVSPDAPGCLLLDVHMMGMNGLVVLAEMRRRAFRMPVIVVTGSGELPQIVEVMRSGVMDLLAKPLDPDILLASVREALVKDAAGRSGTSPDEAVAEHVDSLNPSNHQVVKLIVAGAADERIADRLQIAIETVREVRRRLLKPTVPLMPPGAHDDP